MKTEFQKLDAAVSGADAAGSVDYTTFPNAMPASQEAAPRLGRAYAAGTVGQAEVYARMREQGFQMGEAEATRIWNALGLIAKDQLKKGIACNLGFVRLFPAISGTFPSTDADFDPTRNRLYVAAMPSDAIRDALADGTPTRIDASTEGEARINNVTWGTKDETNTLKSGEPFDIRGSGLTIGYGGEHAELKLPDGGSLSVTLELPPDEKGIGQRLVGRLSQSVEACEGAQLFVWTHGFDASHQLRLVSSPKLTVLAGNVPPGPTGPTLTTINEGASGETIYGTSFTLGGTNLTDATLKFSCEDTHGETVERSVTPESVTATEIVVPNDWDRGVAIPDQGDVTFTATTDGGSAQIHGTYHA